MPNQNPSNVHVDEALTDVSVAYMQDTTSFVANRAFPNISVGKQSDKYWTLPHGQIERDEFKIRAPGTESEGIDWTLSTDSYLCDVRALHDSVDAQTLANDDGSFGLFEASAEILGEKALIHRERKFVTDFMATSIWTTDRTGVASGPSASQFVYWDAAAGDPVANMRTWKLTMQLLAGGRRPNVLILGREGYDGLLENAELKERVKHTGAAPYRVTHQAILELLELDEILVSDAVYNTAAEGAAASYSMCMGKDGLLIHRPRRPGKKIPAAGYQFNWTGYTTVDNEFGVSIEKWWHQDTKSWRVEGEMAFDQKLVSADLGIFLSGVVS